MCTIGPHFKFCTCSDTSDLRDYWKLTTDNNKIYTDVVGSICMSEDLVETSRFSDSSFIQARLDFDLNNTDVFDFDYKPNEGDKVTVHFKQFEEECEEDNFVMVWAYSNGKFQSLEMGEDYVGGSSLAKGAVRFVRSS